MGKKKKPSKKSRLLQGVSNSLQVTQNAVETIIFTKIVLNLLDRDKFPWVGACAAFNSLFSVVKSFGDNPGWSATASLTKLWDVTKAIPGLMIGGAVYLPRWTTLAVPVPNLFMWATMLAVFTKAADQGVKVSRDEDLKKLSEGSITFEAFWKTVDKKQLAADIAFYLKNLGLIGLLSYSKQVGQALDNAESSGDSVNLTDQSLSGVIAAACAELAVSYGVDVMKQLYNLWTSRQGEATKDLTEVLVHTPVRSVTPIAYQSNSEVEPEIEHLSRDHIVSTPDRYSVNSPVPHDSPVQQMQSFTSPRAKRGLSNMFRSLTPEVQKATENTRLYSPSITSSIT